MPQFNQRLNQRHVSPEEDSRIQTEIFAHLGPTPGRHQLKDRHREVLPGRRRDVSPLTWPKLVRPGGPDVNPWALGLLALVLSVSCAVYLRANQDEVILWALNHDLINEHNVGGSASFLARLSAALSGLSFLVAAGFFYLTARAVSRWSIVRRAMLWLEPKLAPVLQPLGAMANGAHRLSAGLIARLANTTRTWLRSGIEVLRYASPVIARLYQVPIKIVAASLLALAHLVAGVASAALTLLFAGLMFACLICVRVVSRWVVGPVRFLSSALYRLSNSLFRMLSVAWRWAISRLREAASTAKRVTRRICVFVMRRAASVLLCANRWLSPLSRLVLGLVSDLWVNFFQPLVSRLLSAAYAAAVFLVALLESAAGKALHTALALTERLSIAVAGLQSWWIRLAGIAGVAARALARSIWRRIVSAVDGLGVYFGISRRVGLKAMRVLASAEVMVGHLVVSVVAAWLRWAWAAFGLLLRPLAIAVTELRREVRLLSALLAWLIRRTLHAVGLLGLVAGIGFRALARPTLRCGVSVADGIGVYFGISRRLGLKPICVLASAIVVGAQSVASVVTACLGAAGAAFGVLLRPFAIVGAEFRKQMRLLNALLAWLLSRIIRVPLIGWRGFCKVVGFTARIVWTAAKTARNLWRAAFWLAGNKKEVISMSEFNLSRQNVLSLIGTLWVLGLIGFFIFSTVVPPSGPTVEVVQWSNSHMTRPGLLPDMAARFNKERHKSASDKRIVVKVYSRDSYEQVDDVRSRVVRGVPLNDRFPDPSIITPSADHWLISANYAAGRQLVDLDKTRSLAHTWIGIVTDRDMAECLGWPNKEIGYSDIIALRNNPRGWQSYACAKAEWGQRPLVAFTDPTTSSTGRSVLYTLYSIAANKPLDQLSVADVNDPAVVGYVKQFQGLVDHYMNGTLPLNTKVYQGPRYGHFFLMPEDNLIHLYQGTEAALINGERAKAPPISRPMVMIYPKEGSTMHNHSASFVEASWVSAEQRAAAEKWVDYLLQEERQQAFLQAGFRPSTKLAVGDPISIRYGLDASKPSVVVNPDRIDQVAAAAIVESWQDVKRPSIVTFVVDTSGSMVGDKLQQAKDGLVRAIDSMAKNNEVGLITFSTGVKARVPVGPLLENRFAIADAVAAMQASGGTDLYEAIRVGIEVTDAAPGRADAARSVVVLTDGRANGGQTRLHDLIHMTSRAEVPMSNFTGFVGENGGIEEGGRYVLKGDVVGSKLKVRTRYPVQVFFIGIGKDADMDIGRMLAEATGAEFQGATEKDLANVLEAFSKYF